MSHARQFEHQVQERYDAPTEPNIHHWYFLKIAMDRVLIRRHRISLNRRIRLIIIPVPVNPLPVLHLPLLKWQGAQTLDYAPGGYLLV